MNTLTKEEFFKKLKTDKDFNDKYGRKNITEGKQVLPPCHYGFQFYTRELSYKERNSLYKQKFGETIEESDAKWELNTNSSYIDDLNKANIPKRAISLMWNQRSVDTPLGLPFNIASYALLLELVGKMVNMVPDELIGNLGDVHIYQNQIEGVKEQLSREPYPLPKLNINTEWWPRNEDEEIDALEVLSSFSSDNFCKCLMEEDIQISNYQSHPTIKFPLSN